MKKIILAALLLLPLFLYSNGNGGYSGSAFRIGLGARSSALGNAGTADLTNGYSFYYNPALTGFVENKIFSLSSNSMTLDRNLNFIGFTMKVPPAAGFSIGWIRSSIGGLYQTNSIGEITGNIDQSMNAVYFNFARPFGEKLSVGVSIKYLWEAIDFGSDAYLSSGWGWEFGVLYRFSENLSAALVARDLATRLSASTDKLFEFGGTTTDAFPKTYLAGLRWVSPFKWLRVLYDFEMSDKQARKHHLGAEAVYQNTVSVRSGYDTDRFTFGAGINFRSLKAMKKSMLSYLGRLDYAFLPSRHGEGSTHIFSWQIFLD